MICSKSCIFLFGHLINLISGWSYENANEWKFGYPECSGYFQSPIVLDDVAKNINESTTIKFEDYDILPLEMFIENTGHKVVVTGEWESKLTPRVIHDGTVYKFVHMDFHWGPTNDGGSEHIMKNKTTPLEVQLVHWNYDLGNYDLEKGEGILIVAILFELGNSAPVYLWNIVEILHTVKTLNSKRQGMWPFPLIEMTTQPSPEFFYTYTGSLTSPPCSEGVTWVIFGEPSKIFKQQMDIFRSVKFSHGDNHNNRPIESTDQEDLFVVPS